MCTFPLFVVACDQNPPRYRQTDGRHACSMGATWVQKPISTEDPLIVAGRERVMCETT